jgi:hypothetical protein
MPRKVTVYSEGTGNDTKIMNEDGAVVDGVYSAQVLIEAGSIVTVELVLKAQSVAIQNATVTQCNLVCSLCGTVEEHTCS